jgi:hypothetical protein
MMAGRIWIGRLMEGPEWGEESERRTEDMPTPMRTPRERTSHHRKAPTRPAAPVPDAKYLSKYTIDQCTKNVLGESTDPTLCPATEGGA